MALSAIYITPLYLNHLTHMLHKPVALQCEALVPLLDSLRDGNYFGYKERSTNICKPSSAECHGEHLASNIPTRHFNCHVLKGQRDFDPEVDDPLVRYSPACVCDVREVIVPK